MLQSTFIDCVSLNVGNNLPNATRDAKVEIEMLASSDANANLRSAKPNAKKYLTP